MKTLSALLLAVLLGATASAETRVVASGIGQPFGVEIGPDGALYVTEIEQHRIIRVDLAGGAMRTVIGGAESGLKEPYEVRFDRHNAMYFVEMVGQVIRRANLKTGGLELLVGVPGEQGFGGDGGPGAHARLRNPHSIAVDPMKNHLYVADVGNHRIRRLDLVSGEIETIAGTGEKRLPTDGVAATGQPMLGPRALFIHGRDLWITLREGNSVWRMELDTGLLHHVAGSGENGYTGDGGDPKAATFAGPKGIAVGPEGRVYVVDTENHVLRVIDTKANRIDSLGVDAGMDRPHGVCVGPDGTVYVGDTNRGRVVAFESTPD
jgi:sugar lactone lactonase YvrE